MNNEEITRVFCWACVKSFENLKNLRFVLQHSIEQREGAFLVIKCTAESKNHSKLVDEDEVEVESESEEVEGILNQDSQINHEVYFQKVITYLEQSKNGNEYLSIAEPCKWSYFRHTGTELIKNFKSRGFAASNRTLVAFSVRLGEPFRLESSCYRFYTSLSRLCKYLLFVFPQVRISFQYEKKDTTTQENDILMDDNSLLKRMKKSRKRKISVKEEEEEETSEIIIYPHSLKITKPIKLSMKDEEEEQKMEEEEEEVIINFLYETYSDDINITYITNPHLVRHMNEVSVINRCRIICYSDDRGIVSSSQEHSLFWDINEKGQILKDEFYQNISFFSKVHNVTELEDGGLHCVDISCDFEVSRIKSCCVIFRFSEDFVRKKRVGILSLSDILRNSLKKVTDSMNKDKKEVERKEEVDRCVEWISSSIGDIVGMSKNAAFREKCLSILGVRDVQGMKNTLEVLVRGKIEDKGGKKKKKKKKKKNKRKDKRMGVINKKK